MPPAITVRPVDRFSSARGTFNSSPGVSITQRSMKFSSSRMFPGQGAFTSASIAGFGIDRIRLCIRRDRRDTKYAQQRDVFAPLAQRRNFDRKDSQPIKKVFAKLIIADHAVQIAMRGRNQTNINVDRLCTSEAFKLPFLQGTQEFRLQIHGDVADLCQEKDCRDPPARSVPSSAFGRP